MVFFLEKSKEKTFHVVFVGVLMGMVICFGNVLIPLWFLFGRALSFRMLSAWTRLIGLGVEKSSSTRTAIGVCIKADRFASYINIRPSLL